MTSVQSSNASLPQANPNDVHPYGTNIKPEQSSNASLPRTNLNDVHPYGTNTKPEQSSNASLPQTNQSDVHPSAIGTNTKPETSSTSQPQPKTEGTNSQFQDKAAAGGIDEHPEAKEQGPGDEGASGQTDESGYPEQMHAGKVGYGPNYHQKPGFTDKLTGLKESVVGKVKRDPELAQHGHDRITGELKKKEMENDMKEDPFADPGEKKQQKEGKQDEQKTEDKKE